MQLPTQRTSSHEFPGLLIKMSLKTANNCGNWHPFLEGFVKIIIPETCLSWNILLYPYSLSISWSYNTTFEGRLWKKTVIKQILRILQWKLCYLSHNCTTDPMINAIKIHLWWGELGIRVMMFNVDSLSLLKMVYFSWSFCFLILLSLCLIKSV